jgi:antirestriction protein ArdC
MWVYPLHTRTEQEQEMQQDNYTLDETEDTEVETLTEESARTDRKWVRDLEKRAKAADKAAAERDAAMRELVMLKAGINPETPQGKLFIKAYDGEPTLEAVKAAAQEYGVLDTPTPAIPADEVAAHQRVAQAAAGAEVSEGDDDPIALINKAESAAEVLELVKKYGVAISDDQPGGFRPLV